MARKSRSRKHGSISPAAMTKKPARKIAKVRFKYIFRDDYNPVYANGAYGGPTSMGEISVHFYVERPPVPLEETHAVGSDGKIAEPIQRMPNQEDDSVTVIRYLTTGVVMTHDAARRVHEFLGRHIQQLDAIKAGQQALSKAAKK